MDKQEDLRVRRTQKLLKAAFLKLLREKRYEQINIQDIADEAMCNRNTFYLHYRDKDDMLETISVDVFGELSRSIPADIADLQKIQPQEISEVIDGLTRAIGNNLVFYQTVMGESGLPGFDTRVKNILRDHMINGAERLALSPVMKERSGIYAEYIASGIVGVINYWLKNQQNCSAELVSAALTQINAFTSMALLKELAVDTNP
jgi:AcrR family transcriptional regulator